MKSLRTLEWRAKQITLIERWQIKMKELRLQSLDEGWNEDKFEMEMVPFIESQVLSDVFIFAKNYVFRYKTGKFRSLMVEAYREIRDFGTIEPMRLDFLKRRIEVARRKMK